MLRRSTLSVISTIWIFTEDRPKCNGYIIFCDDSLPPFHFYQCAARDLKDSTTVRHSRANVKMVPRLMRIDNSFHILNTSTLATCNTIIRKKFVIVEPNF
jgi:hypothetical protein